MKREDIEKAAVKYSNDVFLDNAKVIVDNPWPEFRDTYKTAFESGADWRIKSVWHDTNELPTKSGYLAVLCHNGIMEMRYHSVGIGFLEKTLQGYSQWAYIEDLLPDAE